MAGAGTIPRLAWSIVLDASNNGIRCQKAGGVVVLAAIAAGTYWWRDDATAADLCKALTAALDDAMGATFSCALSIDGILTISHDATEFTIFWGAADTTVADAVFGFDDVGQSSVALSMSSDFQVGRSWWPELAYLDDTETRPIYRSSQVSVVDGKTYSLQWAERFERSIVFDSLPAWKVFEEEERVGNEQEALLAQSAATERPSLWWAKGEEFEFCPDVSLAPGTYTRMVPIGKEFMERMSSDLATPPGMIRRYDIVAPMRKV